MSGEGNEEELRSLAGDGLRRFADELDGPFGRWTCAESPAMRSDAVRRRGRRFGWDAETLPGKRRTWLGIGSEDVRPTTSLRSMAIARRGVDRDRVRIGGLSRAISSTSKPTDVSGPSFDRLNEDLHGPYSPTPP